MQSKSGSKWHLVCRGMKVDVDFAVRGWAETGLRFEGRNRVLCSVVVNHTTGAENPPAAVHHSMSTRRNANGDPEPLSVHFLVDKDGIVYQMADTELRASHCKAHGLNAVSIGIEYICRHTAIDVPSRGTQRTIAVDRIHGRPVRYYELTLAQMRAGLQLNRMLCSLYGLPFAVPLDASGQVISTEMSDLRLRSFRGCIGHLHAEQKKTDPGLGLLRAIRDAADVA